MDFLTIESHFGVRGSEIRAYTRNRCSEDFVQMLKIVAEILYPEEGFEIYLLPPERGSYTDIVKLVRIIKKYAGPAVGAVSAVGVLTMGILTYADTHEEHEHSKRMYVVDDTAKCLALKQQIAELGKNYEIQNIPEEKIKEVCGNVALNRLKNNRYETLQADDMIDSDAIVLKDSQAKLICENKIERKDFGRLIQFLPQSEDFNKQGLNGIVELISLVLKQKQDGRGVQWRGVYIGEDVMENGLNILSSGEEIDFYMQDKEFKKKINNQEIRFASGDNIRVLFDVKAKVNANEVQSRYIYVKEVQSFNEVVIEHKNKLPQSSSKIDENQQSMFD